VLDEVAGDNDDPERFNRPTTMDWAPDGTFFVADGYGNSRVVKFDKDGNYLAHWGKPGTGPGEFQVVHGVAVGGLPPRVFVSDRSNQRIQIFDLNGTYLDEWPGIRPDTLVMSADQHLWAADSATDRIVKFDLSGHLEFAFGQHGTLPGYAWRIHQLSADEEGNLYGAEVFGGRTQKFRPRSGADPTKILWPRPLMRKPSK
jgi:sugar lactone lactonase YvrE